ncbi:MAG TPA: helix-turn-helix domain-containing protein [Acidimicrobiales bacterium]
MSQTARQILDAARTCLVESGYANLSTRRIADAAGVGLGHIHYHFGSKRNLVLALLADENRRLLDRQGRMYGDEAPLWKQWEQACDFLDDDLRSGYVRLLQEMTAAGWSDPEVAAAVRSLLHAWFDLLADVARRAAGRVGGLGPFTAEEVGALLGDLFLGAETMLLLGVTDEQVPHRSALRRVGRLIRTLEEG